MLASGRMHTSRCSHVLLLACFTLTCAREVFKACIAYKWLGRCHKQVSQYIAPGTVLFKYIVVRVCCQSGALQASG